MATDAVCEHGMEMAQLSDQTKEALRSFLPAAASVKNPVDMIASAPLEHYKKTLETVLADDGVDMVVVIYLPFLGLKDIDVAKAVMEIRAAHPDKPIVGVFMTKNEFFAHLSETEVNVPFFMFAEQAVEGLARLNQQRLWRKRTDTPAPRYSVDTEAVEAVFKQAAADNREQLTTGESLQVLTAYGIRVCRDGEAKDADEAVALADKIGYPVVMKLNSKKISHKTDIGGVRVGIKDAAQLRTEFADLVTKLTEKGLMDGFEGVIIQEMVKSDREMVCGCAKDPQYGQMMMFGLGGVFVEVMKDVTFRLAPLTVEDASDMIHSVKAYKLLAGARGATPAQINKVEETLLRLSQLVEDFAFIDELDINPLMISDKDGEPIAVDGRIKFNASEALVALSIA
ncbi:MAG: acetate--CoA ligase family protein [Parasutterella sp.]